MCFSAWRIFLSTWALSSARLTSFRRNSLNSSSSSSSSSSCSCLSSLPRAWPIANWFRVTTSPVSRSTRPCKRFMSRVSLATWSPSRSPKTFFWLQANRLRRPSLPLALSTEPWLMSSSSLAPSPGESTTQVCCKSSLDGMVMQWSVGMPNATQCPTCPGPAQGLLVWYTDLAMALRLWKTQGSAALNDRECWGTPSTSGISWRSRHSSRRSQISSANSHSSSKSALGGATSLLKPPEEV
mmetsp:Transcript_5945/g.16995  ORF Transcript_5945/g.16995 Transcript_5945/m.16995 type:complete len:240 (+) Transcript_5945:369-1088(+)